MAEAAAFCTSANCVNWSSNCFCIDTCFCSGLTWPLAAFLRASASFASLPARFALPFAASNSSLFAANTDGSAPEASNSLYSLILTLRSSCAAVCSRRAFSKSLSACATAVVAFASANCFRARFARSAPNAPPAFSSFVNSPSLTLPVSWYAAIVVVISCVKSLNSPELASAPSSPASTSVDKTDFNGAWRSFSTPKEASPNPVRY